MTKTKTIIIIGTAMVGSTVVQKALELGFDVTQAESGTEALKLAKNDDSVVAIMGDNGATFENSPCELKERVIQNIKPFNKFR